MSETLDPIKFGKDNKSEIKLDGLYGQEPEDDSYYARYNAPLEAPHQSQSKIDKYDKKLRKDIAFFADFYFDMFLEPKQIAFANSCIGTPHTVACFSRQTGKSTMLAILNVHQLVYGKNIFIESYAPTEKQALKVIFARTRQLFESQDILYDQVQKMMRSGWIELWNKNCFQAQTANKDSNIRGFSPSVIEIDESQSIPDEKYHADIKGSGVAMKGLTSSVRRMINRLPMNLRKAEMEKHVTRTRIWEAGTPLGRNHYYENVELPDMGCVVFKQKWFECTFIDEEMIMREKNRMPTRVFQQEFECIFDVDEGYAFDWGDITAAMEGNIKTDFTRSLRGIYVGGVDLGQRVDHTTLSIMEVLGSTRRMVFNYVWDLGKKWLEMTTEIDQFLKIWEPGLILVDCTGQYNRIFEQYFLTMSHPILGYQYNVDTKAELVKLCQVQLEKGNLELWDNESLKREFKQFPEKRLPSGKFQYKAVDEHDDQVNSVMLSLMAAEMYAGSDGLTPTNLVFHTPSRSNLMGPLPFNDDKLPDPSKVLGDIWGGSEGRHRAQEGPWDGRPGHGGGRGRDISF